MDKNLVLFLNAIGISNNNIRKIIVEFCDLKDFIKNYSHLENIQNIDKRIIKRIEKYKNFNYNLYLNRINRLNIGLVFYGDDEYPENFLHIEDPPMILYYKGELSKSDSTGISVVGARKCTNYGAWACEKITRELSEYSLPIISGLASGIDKIAHESALENNNRTIAVLGNGIDMIYPKNNYSLYEKIENRGLIISEYPLGTKPLPYNFPYRNRLISAIGQGVVVIEAMEKSGTLITANYAAEQGKEVFALPGNINSLYSKGTNLLIRDGAKIITSLEDILEEIEYMDNISTDLKIEFENINEQIIYEEIAKGPKSADELLLLTKLNLEEINVVLTILELNGYIIELIGGKFSIS